MRTAGEAEFTPERGWIKFHGPELEPVPRSGAIALLSTRWLIDLAASQENDTQVVIARRQELPEEAFLSCDQVIACTALKPNLPVIALSHMWLTRSHPDPAEQHCSVWLSGVETFCKTKNRGRQRQRIWVSFGIMRHCTNPDPSKEIYRTAEEEDLFRQGLGALGTLFSHTYVTCFKVTQFPDAEGLPDDGGDANCAPYNDRGWTFVESCWASMTKSKGLTYDICLEKCSKYNAGKTTRLAPVSPERMEQCLQEKTFTNGKSDQTLVLGLYEDHFRNQFGSLKLLNYANMRWDDEAIQNVAEILGAGHMPLLEQLNLGENAFGLRGCQALAKALEPVPSKSNASPPCPRLREITLSGQKGKTFDDACVQVLANALVRVETVHLASCPNVGTGACRALAASIRALGPNDTKLLNLHMHTCPKLGSEGVEALLGCPHPWRWLTFSHCSLDNRACQALADAAVADHDNGRCGSQAPFSRLKYLRLDDNPIDEGATQSLCELVKHCPILTILWLPSAMENAKTAIHKCAANPSTKINITSAKSW